MSPAVNVTLEEVPFAILEAVKARILAQRRRLDERKQRPSLRPRPQFRNVGASNKEWRPPQPVAGVIPERIVVGGFYEFPEIGRNLIRTLDGSKEYLVKAPTIEFENVEPSSSSVEVTPIIEQDIPGTFINTGSNTIVYKRRTVQATPSSVSTRPIVLPAGGRNVILCFASRVSGFRNIIESEQIYTYQTFLTNGDIENPAFATNHQATHSYSSSTSGPFISERKFEALLVSDTDIKSIPVPSQIIDLFDQISGVTEGVTQAQSSTVYASYPEEDIANIIAQIDFPSSPSTGQQYATSLGIFTFNGAEWVNQGLDGSPRVDVKSVDTFETQFSGFGLLGGSRFYEGVRTPGTPNYIDNYTTTVYTPASTTLTGTGTFFNLNDRNLRFVGLSIIRGYDLLIETPAIFTTIRTREYAEDGLLPSEMVDIYLSDVPRPIYTLVPELLEGEEGNFITFDVRFDYTRDLDVTENSKIIKNNKETYRLKDDGLLRFVYDWGQPNYCRQQCLNLGFRPEDLKF